MPATRRATRDRRFNFRATARQQRLITSGARETGGSVSQFIIESACIRAEQALASKQDFKLKDSKWNEFLAALDRPVQAKPRLERLFSTSSVLER